MTAARRIEKTPICYLTVKASISGTIVALASEFARRQPTLGVLVLSLPLTSIFGILWLWYDTRDAARVAALAQSTFWYVLPTLPMFLPVPSLLRAGVGFWPSLAAGHALTVVLYLITVWALAGFGTTL